jgi:hypothetical protein
MSSFKKAGAVAWRNENAIAPVVRRKPLESVTAPPLFFSLVAARK